MLLYEQQEFEKIHNELGWLPETKFADGIKLTIDWYLNNREWWRRLLVANTRIITRKCMETDKKISLLIEARLFLCYDTIVYVYIVKRKFI